MQYKLFSTSKEWLPKPPENYRITVPVTSSDADTAVTDTAEDTLEKDAANISLPKHLPLTGGSTCFQEQLKIANKQGDDLVAVRDTIDNFHAVFKDLDGLSELGLAQHEQRFNAEADYGDFSYGSSRGDFEYLTEAETRMIASSDADTGFIVWLNYVKGKSKKDTPAFSDIVGNKTALEHVTATIESFDPSDLLNLLSAPKTAGTAGIESDEDDNGEDSESDADDGNAGKSSSGKIVVHRSTRPTKGKAKNKNKSIPAKFKKMHNGAKQIAKTAAQMLGKVKNNSVAVGSKGSKFQYKFAQLTPEELEFYNERSTLDSVLKLTANIYAQADPWYPFPPNEVLSPEAILLQQRQKDKHDKDIASAEDLAKNVLTKNKYGNDPNAPIVVGATVKSTVSEKANRKEKGTKKVYVIYKLR